MILASIDLGTNTCNLSIAKYTSQETEYLFSEKFPIKLGAEGFKNGAISQAAINRIIQALSNYKQILKTYQVDYTEVFATSGLRNASNQFDILKQVKEFTGFEIQVISGDKEAGYIFQGVKLAVPLNSSPCVLLDIGGGSVEIQVVNSERVFFRKSFDLGIARLLNKFSTSDPLSSGDISEINEYLKHELKELNLISQQYQPEILIGSSGSFDTFASLYYNGANLLDTVSTAKYDEIPLNAWYKMYDELITFNRVQRLAMQGMEPMRVEMIPLAAVFTNFLINLFPVKKLVRSAFALKEGVFQSMAEKLLNDH